MKKVKNSFAANMMIYKKIRCNYKPQIKPTIQEISTLKASAKTVDEKSKEESSKFENLEQ